MRESRREENAITKFFRLAHQLAELCQLITYCLEDTVFEAEKGEFIANRETLSLPGAHRLMLELGQRGPGKWSTFPSRLNLPLSVGIFLLKTQKSARFHINLQF